jgi:hypothetical protein
MNELTAVTMLASLGILALVLATYAAVRLK